MRIVDDGGQARIRCARARLDAAIAGHELARRDDNRLKSPATKDAREKAARELDFAVRLVSELIKKEREF